MESNIPKYDLPVDYIVGEGFAKDLLKSYKNFPCKIESGLFILCKRHYGGDDQYQYPSY
jgi:AraC family transcriptional activator of pobA